ncbi:hypothetical protein [Aquabacterium humicola]|uniref:hypothetical protein n=1 Tax=Aquabacterium humicola TaxID=3237377 RepID=UPI002542E8BE|nr:hypothetical protein [Rubrivivax pictus]
MNGINLATWPWTWPAGLKLAPDWLGQTINPGWTLAGVVVNPQNSSAPAVEQSVLSHHSYGRQLGRLMDAVEALLDAAPAKVANDPRAADLRTLAREIERIKAEAASDRIDRLTGELALVRKTDPDGWKRLQAALAR